jgi:hypothetical protein
MTSLRGVVLIPVMSVVRVETSAFFGRWGASVIVHTRMLYMM